MTLRLRAKLPQDGSPLGPDEVWVCIGGNPHKVYRGRRLVGWLIDRTDYPWPQPAPAHPQGGYQLTATSTAINQTFGATRADDSEVPGTWPNRRAALEALLGEKLEG